MAQEINQGEEQLIKKDEFYKKGLDLFNKCLFASVLIIIGFLSFVAYIFGSIAMANIYGESMLPIISLNKLFIRTFFGIIVLLIFGITLFSIAKLGNYYKIIAIRKHYENKKSINNFVNQELIPIIKEEVKKEVNHGNKNKSR